MYGNLVRRVRTERGLTQAALAELSGLAQSNLSAIENQKRMPSSETLHRLIESCGFQLAAVAGARVISCGPLSAEPTAALPVDPPTITASTPMTERVRALTAVLDASEAIVRGRGWTS